MIEFIKKYRVHVAALLFAGLVWFLVVTENYFEYVVHIPVTISNLKAGTIVSSPIPSSAQVKFRARGRSLLRLFLFKDAKLVLDLDRKVGRWIVSITTDDVVLRGSPTDIEVVELVSSDTVSIHVEPLVKKWVPIESQVTIKTISGYTIVGFVKLEPDSVSLEGPSSVIDQYVRVQTDSRTFKQVKHPLKEEVGLICPDNPNVRLLSSKIIVLADIQKLMEKYLAGIPVKIKSIPRNMKAIVIPSHLSLTIEGGVDQLTKVTKEDIIAYVDLKKEWTSSEKGHPAYIETPEGVRYRDVTPKYFKVVLEKE